VRSRRHLLELILAAACWGIGTAVSKQAVAEVPPLTLLVVQLAISVGLLAVVVARRREPLPGGPAGRRLGWLGLLNPGLAYALSLLGLTQISASFSVLIWSVSEPILILLLAAWILGERIGGSLVALSAVAIGGLVVVLYDPSAAGAMLGIGLTVAGIGCCAIYTVASRRWLPGADSTLAVILVQEAYGLGLASVILVGLVVAGVSVLPSSLTAAGVVSTVVSGLVYYGLAYWFYLSALRQVPASIAAASFYLIPVFGVAAATLLGDRLGPSQWVGVIIVIAAVVGIGYRTAGSQASISGEVSAAGGATAAGEAAAAGGAAP